MYGQYNPYQAIPQRYEVIHVNGEPGAQALAMAPNSNVIVMDDTAPLVWLCQTDGAGYKTCTPFSIAPYKPQRSEDLLAELAEKIKRIEEKLNESNGPVTAQTAE